MQPGQSGRRTDEETWETWERMFRERAAAEETLDAGKMGGSYFGRVK